MDSIIAKANDGFDKDGNFLNGQTDLLPWPADVKFGYLCDITSEFGNSQLASAAVNPYDSLGGYFYSDSQTFRYYNADNTMRWMILRTDLPRRNMSFIGTGQGAFVIHRIDNIPHYVGLVSENSSSHYRIIKINLVDMSAVISSQPYENLNSIRRFGVLENNTLYCIFSNSSTSLVSKLIDVNTLTMSTTIENCGIIKSLKSSWSSSSAINDYAGVALFNGSLTMSNVSGGQYGSGGFTFDVAAVLYGINSDLDMTTSKYVKKPLRTLHRFANNMFQGTLNQISKDLFFAKIDTQFGYWNPSNPSNKYFTRNELETWASNSIYATTGFRIPLLGSV